MKRFEDRLAKAHEIAEELRRVDEIVKRNAEKIVHGNTNCLAGMRCPECGSYEPFIIEVYGRAEVWDDGIEEITDTEWDSDYSCICKRCGCARSVHEFRDQGGNDAEG